MKQNKKTIKKKTRIASSLLNILVCPDTKSLLIYDKKIGELISIQGKKAYPIEQNVPLISKTHCRELSDSEINKWQNSIHRK